MHAPPEAPPTAAPPRPPAETAWPSALGVIAIVFGVLGVLGAVFGLLVTAFEDEYFGLFGGAVTDEAAAHIAAASPHPAVSGALQVAGLLAAAMLAVGGVRVARRRRCGASLLQVWAVIKMALVVIGSVIGARVGAASFQAGVGAGGGGAGAGVPPGFGSMMMVVGLVFGVLWGWALPVFCLVWLRRAKIRAEVAGWEV